MPLFKFEPNEIFHNRIKTHPQNNFFIFSGNVFYNDRPHPDGLLNNDLTASITHTPSGYLSLYELNIDRPTTSLIYPFVTKNGSFDSFKTISDTNFNTQWNYGDEISWSYPMSASISSDWFFKNSSQAETTLFLSADAGGMGRKQIISLENTLNHYKNLSTAFGDTTTFRNQEMRLISIPSIFYGSSIKKGSVDLKFYLTGTLVGQLQDAGKNGELIQTGPTGSTGSGSVAGLVLYNEGFLLLTGSWDLSSNGHQENYIPLGECNGVACYPGGPVSSGAQFSGNPVSPSWIYFGTTGTLSPHTDRTTVTGSSFNLYFEGTNYVSTITMMAHADRGALNYSNNPTFLTYGQAQISDISKAKYVYQEPKNLEIKNTVKSVYNDPTGSFKKQVWISKIGIYDDDKNLIAVAKLANPVKKNDDRSFTFKLKMDI